MSLIDIGPEAFTDSEETVINYKGQNYYRSCDAPVKSDSFPNGDSGQSLCCKRINHPGDIHEDWGGNTRTMAVYPDGMGGRLFEIGDHT